MAQPSTSHPLISCADRKIRYGPITHHNYSDRLLAHIIHDGSSRNREVATRDGRVELRGREAYLKQYVDRPSGEPARLAV